MPRQALSGQRTTETPAAGSPATNGAKAVLGDEDAQVTTGLSQRQEKGDDAVIDGRRDQTGGGTVPIDGFRRHRDVGTAETLHDVAEGRQISAM